MRNLLYYLKEHKLQFAGALALGIATVLAGIGLMSSSGYLISRAAQRPMLVDLFVVTAAVRFFGISRAVVRYAERVVSHDLTFKILSDMRSRLYRKLDALSLTWMMGQKSGDLLARLVGNVDTLQNVYIRILAPSVTAVVISGLTFTGLCYFDLSLAITTLAFLAFSGVVIPLLATGLEKGTGSKDVSLKSGLKAWFVDRLAGLQDILWLGQKQNSEREAAEVQQQINAIQKRNAGLSGILEGLHILAAHMGMFTVLILAIPIVLDGNIPGVMLAMLTLGVLSSFESVQNLGNAFLHLNKYRQSSARIHTITDHPVEMTEPPRTGNIPINHPIIFENVSFSYEAEYITLQDISFTIPRYSKIAIVGPSGSGKSTLVNLLLRFWDPHAGKILLNNSDIRDYHPEVLRSLFAVVSQDAYVFQRSVRENLLMADPSANDQQLRGVLEKTGLGVLAKDPDLKTLNPGTRLSGGEKRLLTLARALLKDAPIWILDEPTANLDVKTERKMLDTIRAATEKRTVILITHRLLDMEKMDEILVMHQGRIIEKGTHSQLLAGNSFYKRMIHYQMSLV
jgi:ATP-binding cassette subfamily C protein CydC